MGKFFFKIFFAVLIFCFMTLPLVSQENESEQQPGEPQSFSGKISWFFEASVMFFPEKNGVYSDPMPILPSPGVGVSYPFTNIFKMELTLDFYMTHYGYSGALDRAVPTAIENRSARVIGSVLGFQGAAYFDITKLLTVRAYGGLAADLRIIIMAAGLAPEDEYDASRQTGLVRKYFWSKGRWFLPVMGVGLDFSINDNTKLGIDFRVWAPLYRLWTGENLPAIEGWRFNPGIRFTIRKPVKKAE